MGEPSFGTIVLNIVVGILDSCTHIYKNQSLVLCVDVPGKTCLSCHANEVLCIIGTPADTFRSWFVWLVVGCVQE